MQLTSVLVAATLQLSCGFAVSSAVHRSPVGSRDRSPVVRMGGPSGLPRIPQRALPLTKKYNPSMEYDLEIATLWRDLEITFGTPDSPNEDLAFKAAKRCPDLLNPKASSRWVFFRSKDLLIKATGSERGAISVINKDPGLLLCNKYDQLNPKFEQMMLDAGVDTKASGIAGPGVSPEVIAGGVAVAAGIVLAAANGGLG